MDETASESDSTPGQDATAVEPARFGRLLAILVVSFIASGIRSPAAITVSVALNLLLVIVAFRATGLRTTQPRLYALAALALAAILFMAAVPNDSSWRAIPAFAQVLLSATLVVALLLAVLKRDVVDIQTILGAVSAYLLIGAAFSWLYLGMDILDEQQFSMPSTETNQFPDFSYVVLTTLGFGNQLPTDSISSRFVVAEAITGQIFLATFVARLVALYGRTPDRRRPDGEI